MVDSHSRPRGIRRGPRLPASVMEAARGLVLDFDPAHLSALTGTPAGTLYNKVSDNPENNNKPTLAEGIVWTNLAVASGVADSLRIPRAFAQACGGVFVPLHGLGAVSDEALLDLVLRRGVEQGEFDEALSKCLEDGRISAEDYALLHREGFEAIGAFLELLYRLEGMVRG